MKCDNTTQKLSAHLSRLFSLAIAKSGQPTFCHGILDISQDFEGGPETPLSQSDSLPAVVTDYFTFDYLYMHLNDSM